MVSSSEKKRSIETSTYQAIFARHNRQFFQIDATLTKILQAVWSHERLLEVKKTEGRSKVFPEIGNKAIKIVASSSSIQLEFTRNAKGFERSRTYGTADPCA
jgi:hypothetical protein